jgi:lipopolysaccharide/colanic/teichoic acid biosynthesis glycosyltransferase
MGETGVIIAKPGIGAFSKMEQHEQLPFEPQANIETKASLLHDIHILPPAETWFEQPRKRSTSYLAVKRTFDIVSSGLLLAVIWPLFPLIALAVKLDSKGPVLFRHKRVGQDGKPLLLYKFRTMVNNAETLIDQFTEAQRKEWTENYKLERDPRITRVGRFLRRTSLDELPQIAQIFTGKLSVVGPRPVIGEELEKYGAYKYKFLGTKPGLTGYWQAYARNDCSYQQRMEMELYYIDNAAYLLDFRILLQTLVAVARGKGAC